MFETSILARLLWGVGAFRSQVPFGARCFPLGYHQQQPKNKRKQSSHLLSGVVNTAVSSDARLHKFVSLSQACSHTVYSVFPCSPLAVQVCELHSIGCEVEDVELRWSSLYTYFECCSPSGLVNEKVRTDELRFIGLRWRGSKNKMWVYKGRPIPHFYP